MKCIKKDITRVVPGSLIRCAFDESGLSPLIFLPEDRLPDIAMVINIKKLEDKAFQITTLTYGVVHVRNAWPDRHVYVVSE